MQNQERCVRTPDPRSYNTLHLLAVLCLSLWFLCASTLCLVLPAYLARSSKCSQGEGWTTSHLAVQRVAEIQVTAAVPLLSVAFSVQLWLWSTHLYFDSLHKVTVCFLPRCLWWRSWINILEMGRITRLIIVKKANRLIGQVYWGRW